ncbi:COG1835 Predicted acyltransferases [actinobacterium SCGC AAA044-D11]
MISGFVVTPLIIQVFTEKSIGGVLSNLKKFYVRRFYRLAPAAAASLGLFAIVILLLGPPGDHQRFARQGLATLLLIGNLGANSYSGDYFSPNPNPLVHTWSLSVEEQIYIFLPILLIIILINQKNIKLKITITLLFITLISFFSFQFSTVMETVYFRLGIQNPHQFSFYSPFDRIWQFTLGGLAYLLSGRSNYEIKKFSNPIKLCFTLFLFLTLFTSIQISLKNGSIIASSIAVFVITFRSLEILPNFIVDKLEWLGDRSYSIYLVHMPLLYIAKHSFALSFGSDRNRMIQSMTAVIASILLGSLSYSKIEDRFRRNSERKTSEIQSRLFSPLVFFLVPLLLFASIDTGARNNYWGWDKNIEIPPDPGDIDRDCNRNVIMGPPCMYYSNEAKKTVLLIGDSHARHISQSVVDAAKNANWNSVVWTLSACHFQFNRTVQKEVSDECMDRNKEIMSWIEENTPDLVIVSQFIYKSSTQKDLREALLKLRSTTSNILLVENNPVFPDKKDFMISRPLLMKPHIPAKSFPISKMHNMDTKASNSFATWAKNNRIYTVDFSSLFCSTNECTRYSKEKGWLYRDVDHFSVAGAELLRPQLTTFLLKF